MIAHRMMSRTALLDVGIAEPIKTGENRKCCQIFFRNRNLHVRKSLCTNLKRLRAIGTRLTLGACALAPFWPI